MAIQNQGWAYVSSSAPSRVAGVDTNIQFNNNGSFSGSSGLTTDGSGSLSASVHVSASTFYGDGSNLTGVTASAVNVADGPEYAIQFRRDSPVSGEISGSADLIWVPASNTLSGTYAQFTAATASAISFNGAANTAKITNNGSNLNINSPGSIVLSSGNSNVSSSANVSASAFYANGVELTVGGGGGGGGIFTELDSSNAYTTSSLSVGTSDAPGATLHVSSSGDEALFRVDGLTEIEPVLFVTGSGRVGIRVADPTYALDVSGNIALGDQNSSGYILSRNSPTTNIRFGSAGATSIGFKAGNVQLFLIDNDSPDKIVLGAAADNNIIVSGSLLVSGSISGSDDVNVGGTLNALNSAAMLWGGLDLNSVGITATGPIADATTVSGTYAQFTAVTASAIVGGSPLLISSSATTVTGSLAVSDLDEGGILFAGASGELNTDVDSLQWSTDRDDNDGYLALFVSSSASGSAALADGMFMLTDAEDEDICYIDYEGAEFAVDIAVDADLSGSGDVNVGNNLFVYNNSAQLWGGLDLNSVGITATGPIADATTVSGTYAQFTAVTASALGIGVPAGAPPLSLNVHYTGSGNPSNLSNDTGGGEVVYFGTASANLTAGGVYYLNAGGGWESADSANTGSGHNQLIGIAMGQQPWQDGVLIKGYFDANTYLSGAFIKGGPIYIQSSSVARTATGGGYLSGAAPSAADSYVRVVGYGTDTANVIYFNPDSTYIELA